MLQKRRFEGLGFSPECREVELHSQGTQNIAQFCFVFLATRAGEAGAGR